MAQRNLREERLAGLRFILPVALEGELYDERLWISIRKFLHELTPSHSITSKRHSVWKLIAKYLDEPIEKCLSAYLSTTTQSSTWMQWFNAENKHVDPTTETYRTTDWIYITLSRFRLSDSQKPIPNVCKAPACASVESTDYSPSPAALTHKNLVEWRKHLTALTIALRATEPQQTLHSKNLLEALNFCVTLLSALIIFTAPTRYRTVDCQFQTWDSMQHRTDSFCELCYRRTMRAIACAVELPSMSGWSQEQRHRKISSLNNRFCWYHNPSHIKSRDIQISGMRDEYFQYDKDRLYRKAFPTGMFGSGTSSHITDNQPWILPGVDFDTNEQTLRRAVYDVLHVSGLFKVLSTGEVTPTLRAHIYEMHTTVDMTQAEIARELRVSRQTVNRHCKAMSEFFRFRQFRRAVTLAEEAFPPEDDAIIRRSIGIGKNHGPTSLRRSDAA
ncbi:helix-turn-helix domain-containing protein [Alcaligenaceae bacterium]|nr:helix-turn-helix domain-containing protein [Alcaligenaceae bacterium]